MAWSCTIPGQPVGKARARVAVRNGKAHAYTPERTANWEGVAAAWMRSQWGRRKPLSGAVVLRITALFGRPGRLDYHDSPPGRLLHTDKPDWDNLGKIVSDAMQKARVVNDDCQVCCANVTKYYVARGEKPSVTVVVSPWTGEGDAT